MKKKYHLTVTLLLFCFCGISYAENKLILLKDRPDKNSEYTSVLCFRINEIDNGCKTHGGDPSYLLQYFDGPVLNYVQVPYHGKKKYNNFYNDDMVYLAAKPGKYDFWKLSHRLYAGGAMYVGGATINILYSFPLNTVIELKAGKAYYVGEVTINEDNTLKYTWSFKQNKINDTIVHDFEKQYPNTFSAYKNDFVQATFSLPTPFQPINVVFSSHFAKSEVKWNEANDSLHTALYENGQFCIESKSIYNMGAEIIELPEKITNTTFDIELRCNWKNGVNSNAFGLIIPGQFSDTKCRKDELEPRGYIFGISSNGFAGIWYEFKNALGKGYYTLTDWKNMISIKTNSSGQNTIRVQVIDNVITYYVNDMFVSRALYNKFNATEGGLIINEKLDMNNFKDVPLLDKTFKHLGIFSYNKQKIEFDEIKVSKFE